MFETRGEVLAWYEKQERSLTPEFIANLPWHEVKNHHLDPRFVPVLLYMRDVETLTDMYQRELRRTPTGRDPVIGKFMERWGVEEITHGEVLDRFLNEAGHGTPLDWQERTRRAVTRAYRFNTYLLGLLTNLFGGKFTATHMAYGAIHEITTAQGYRRLMQLADHPVLTKILKAIIREEAAHTQFYWNVARLELRRSNFAAAVAGSVVEKYWNPVGQGSLARSRTEYVVRTLFGGAGGLAIIEASVVDRVRQLPGFAEVTRISKRVGDICRDVPQGVDRGSVPAC